MAGIEKKKDIKTGGSVSFELETQKDTSSVTSSETKKTEKQTGSPQLDYKSILDQTTAQATTKAIAEMKQYVDNEFKKRDIDQKIKKIEDKIDKLDDKQINIIQTLAIFVALFTFVSIEFQVFRIYQYPQAIAGLTLILLGSILTFITILDFVLNVRYSITKTQKITGMIEPALQMSKRITGYEEEIEFSWLKPSTWGLAVKIKTIPLICLWLLFIISGVLLFITLPKAETKNENVYRIENYESSIKIQDNTSHYFKER